MKPPVFRSPRKPRGAGAERREEILTAALRLFGEKGVHAVSTRQIAAAAGISQPALYAYFATRDDIAVELTVRAFSLLKARITEAAAVTPDDGSGFEAFMRGYIEFGLENPDAYRVAFMIESDKRPPAGERGLAAGMAAFGEFQAVIARLHGRGVTVDQDLEVLSQTIWAAAHGLVSLLIARPTFPWAERKALIAAHVALLRRAALKP